MLTVHVIVNSDPVVASAGDVFPFFGPMNYMMDEMVGSKKNYYLQPLKIFYA